MGTSDYDRSYIFLDGKASDSEAVVAIARKQQLPHLKDARLELRTFRREAL